MDETVMVDREDLGLLLAMVAGVRRSPLVERLSVVLNDGVALDCRDIGHWWDNPVGNSASCLREDCGGHREWHHKRRTFVYSKQLKEKVDVSDH